MYQLVLQFPTAAVDFDGLIAIEDELIRVVGDSANVDGHDFGSGEGNIFILTEDVGGTWKVVLPALENLSIEGDATVAYRTVDGQRYTVLWPHDFSGEFSLA
jgi:hypothetical protein